MDFDANSFYTSSLWDEKLVNPKIETVYAFTFESNDEINGNFNIQTFTHGSAILKVLCYNPSDLKFQQTPVREKIEKHVINRMRNVYNIDLSSNVDIQKNVKLGGKVRKIDEDVRYEENFKT